MERSRQFAQTSRHSWLQFILAELFILRTKEPSEIKAAEVAAQQVRAQRHQRAHPSCPVVPVIVLELIFKCNDHRVSRFSHLSSFAWEHGSGHFVIGQFQRKAEIQLTRSPVRNVEKRVEVLFQQLERICLQVSPFVVIRETG